MESSSSNISQAETPNPIRETEKKRRPRVRDVRSRFMSPVVSSSSSGDLHLPTASSSSRCPLPNPKHPSTVSADMHQNHHHHPYHRSQSVQRRHPSPSPSADSQHQPLSDDNIRNLDTPLPGKATIAGMKKRPPTRYSTKENGDPQYDRSRTVFARVPGRGSAHARTRLDTPIPILDRNMTPMTATTSTNHRSMMFSSAATTAATKLLQCNGLTAQKRSNAQETPSDTDDASVTSGGDDAISCCSELSSEVASAIVCDSPPVPSMSCKIRSVSEFRSSMPEADLFPTMSARRAADGCSIEGNDACKVSASSPCYRSLNAALSSCQQSFSPTKSVSRSSVFCKPNSTSAKAISLPPNPSSTKPGMEASRKLKKGTSHQEDIHLLRLTYNRYLQWRFANAKAEATMYAERISAENSLYNHIERLSKLRDSVASKRVELEHLKRIERLSSIIDSQIPYMDEWSSMEADFSSSLSGVVKALYDASLRLPITGSVRVDTLEIYEALDSANTILESISTYIESSLPKAEGVENVFSKLAEVACKERALIEECTEQLSEAHKLQVEECSLRAHLLQSRRDVSVHQPKEEAC